MIVTEKLLETEIMRVGMVVSSALPPTVEPLEETSIVTEGLECTIEASLEDTITPHQVREEYQGQ